MSRVDPRPARSRPARSGPARSGPARSGPARSATRRHGPAALSLVLALLVAGAAGWYPYSRLAPSGYDASVGPGQSVVLGGVRYRLDRFTIAPTLPPQDKTDPPAKGPPGSMLVLVVVEQTVLDHHVDLDDHYCDVTLSDGSARTATVWRTDGDYTSLAARPAAYGCSGTTEHPVRYDVTVPMGFSFVVPTDRADHVTARLQVTDGGPALQLRP